MRRIAAVSIIALLALACSSGQDAAGTPEAKSADPNAEADAKVDAKVETEPPVPPTAPVGQVTPTPTPPVEPAPPPADDFGQEFCATIIPCYQKLEFAGNFTADVSVDIEPDGSVSAVSFTGEAPKPVQSCITTAIKNTKLTGYNGKPGRTRCTKSGQLMGGTQMGMSDHTYELRDPGAKAKANNNTLKGKGKGKAEAKAG